MVKTILSIAILLVLLVTAAHAARLANTFTKEFILQGEPALAAAEILGFSKTEKEERQYRLAADEWICKPENCGPRGEQTNTIAFEPGENPKLTLRGQWTDAETGSLEKVPQFRFTSPIVSKDDPEWSAILRSVKDEKPIEPGYQIVASRSTKSELPQFVQVVVYLYPSSTKYRVEIGVDIRSPVERAEKRRKGLQLF